VKNKELAHVENRGVFPFFWSSQSHYEFPELMICFDSVCDEAVRIFFASRSMRGSPSGFANVHFKKTVDQSDHG
jgi:hypothetical protein